MVPEMGNGLFRVSQASSAPNAPEAVGPTFLTYEEAQGLYPRKRALFIDARFAYDFSAGHFKGAVSVPLHELGKNHPILTVLPKDQILVAYCDGAGRNSSAELAKTLYGFGYSNVKVFFGGWNEWLAHKHPTEP
jgi:rhodanese-related sulfurtransferase